MSERFISLAPTDAEPTLRALVGPDAPGGPWLRSEWAWSFHGGKSVQWQGARGTIFTLAHNTVFGHLVVVIDDDRDDLRARARAAVPLEDPAAVGARFSEASSDGAKITTLTALAAAQANARGVLLGPFEAGVRAALDDPSAVVRLTAIRALGVAPMATALALLEGREDAENPELETWRDHFREVLAKETAAEETAPDAG